jgi:hypothetical protein
MKKQFTLIAIATILIMTSCGSGSNTTNESTTVVDNWYKGGTLHKAKISDWKTATIENKLATCGDFMATVDNTVTMTDLKRRATELNNCIDEATRGLESTNSEAVSSIAALCAKTMGY